MKNTSLKELFATNGRRNRRSYIYISAVMFLCWMLYFLIFIALFQRGNEFNTPGLSTGAIWTLALLLIPLSILGAATYLCAAQRCRDFGWTGWSVLLGLVPCLGSFFMIALWFVPGNIGPNRYGDDPQYAPRGYQRGRIIDRTPASSPPPPPPPRSDNA